MKSMNIYALIEQCADALFAKGYNEASIRDYRHRWNRHVVPFVISQGETQYTSELGEKFLKSWLPGKSLSHQKSLKRGVAILNEYLEKGSISRRLKVLPEHPLDGTLGEIAKEYLLYLEREKRLRDLTIYACRRQLSLFIGGVQAKGIDSLDDISENDILEFLNLSAQAQRERRNCLRLFLRHQRQIGNTDRDFSDAFRQFRLVIPEKLPSVYTDEEISMIVKYAKENAQSPVGKRDYAMILLACRLGMRSSDIRYLQFSNIDWENREIHLQQYKTGVDLRLPLLHDVGDAIITYIKSARPESSKPYIFLSMNAPYDTITATSISHHVGCIIKHSGVIVGRRHMGSHALRHSLASHLIKIGIGLPVVSEVLGHVETSSTMYYIGVSRQTLLSCTLPVPQVSNKFYTQRGGIFYA